MALAKDIRETIDMCRHCFMCRHANPTFLVTKLDAHTPRGYALGLSRIDDGLAEWSGDLAEKLFASTLDGLCSELCEFDWREDLVVQAGREEAVRHGVAPEAVRHAAQRRQAGAEADAGSLPIEPDRFDREGAEVLFLTGLDARERAPETIAATAAILDHLGTDWTALSVENDPGIDLWELGYAEASAAAAERFAAEVAALRPARLLTGSSRVLRALREPLPAELAGLPEAEHLSEFMLDRLSPPVDAAATTSTLPGEQIVYHDPCSLGRRRRVFDAPREVIEKVTAAAPTEFFHSREIAECCGDGGVLPEIDPELAARLARAQLERMPEGTTTVVTACPGCRAQLGDVAAAGGYRVKVIDISELVADRLGLS